MDGQEKEELWHEDSGKQKSEHPDSNLLGVMEILAFILENN